ncbi:MAG: acyl-CoA dehydrogenase family protein [Burkholderiales bacterium]
MSRDEAFLAWPFFEERHRRLADELHRFEVPEEKACVDQTCRELVHRLGEAGLLRHCCVLEAGAHFDVRSLALSRDILARREPLADFAFAMQGLGTGPISLFGSGEQRLRYLPPVIKGRKIAAFALSEPEAGSDVQAIATRARREGPQWVLDGTKTWISNGGIADHYVVFARTGEEQERASLGAFIVDAGTAGLKVVGQIQTMAPHPLATVEFQHCRLGQEALIGTPTQGMKIALATLDVFRTTVGAAALGLARRALDEALARVKSRRVFGKPLAEFQLTQARLADMALAVDAAALLVYRAAWVKDATRGRVTREAAMAKLFATESAQEVIDSALQLFGGTGVVSGMAVERLYREIRALRIYEGTSEIQKLVIADSLLREEKVA